MIDHSPPYSLEAEQSVLSAVCMDNEALDLVADMLLPEDFYLNAHRILFSAMVELYCGGKPVDLVSIVDHLTTQNKLEIAGGPAAVSDLAGRIGTSANIEYWAKIIKEKASLRNVINICTSTVHEVYGEADEPNELIDRFQGRAMSLTDNCVDSGVVKIQKSSLESFAHIESVHEGRGSETGTLTGIGSLDFITGGLQKGGYAIFAARPSMGKSALALNIALHMALAGSPVAYFSSEMTRDVLTKRLISIVCGCTFERMMRYRGSFTSEEFKQITAAVTELQKAKLTLIDRMDMSELTVRNISRRQRKEYGGLAAVFVDHIGHLSYSQRHKGMSENAELTKISRNMKGLAKELDTSVVVISQLNRDCEKRPDKRPILADLRDSGSLEQDADVIGFLYREGYYNKEKNPGATELNVAKNRNGATGRLNLWFDLATQKITDYRD